MDELFNKALEIAKDKYPYDINFYEEYKDFFIFGNNDGNEYFGGDRNPIVIRKCDMEALNYDPTVFMGLDADAEGIGDIISEGSL